MKTNFVGTVLRGLAMGMAEAVPGVSGGTIAFITGIYERLIEDIKKIGPDMFRSFMSKGIPTTFKEYDLYFLSILLFGMFLGLIVGVFGIHYFLQRYPPVVWAFFFGLILASVYFLYTQIHKKTLWSLLYFIIGTVISFYITTLTPTTGSMNLGYVFLSGFVAISALMLPGISGSYILLLMGMYVTVTDQFRQLITHWNQESFTFLVVFALGCLVGVVSLSRLLSYTFRTYHDETIATLSGVVLGSITKIWPWQNPTFVVNSETGEYLPYSRGMEIGDVYEVINEVLVWPNQYYDQPYVIASVIAIIAGISLVLSLGFSSKETL